MICETNKCTGCGACSALCPKKCIEMIPDECGFYVPHIDNDRCINCGICERNCPINASCISDFEAEYSPRAFSFIHSNPSVLGKSSSGGAFMAFAEAVIANGGVVFGAVFDEHYSVVTASTEDSEGLSAMQGSKYVECVSGNSYQTAKEYLTAGRRVLYTGTPCRIAGLYAALGGKKYPNLITAEIICHGVPSNKLFQAYLAYAEKKYGKILSYTFREKSKWGWGSWGSFTYDKNGKNKVRHFSVASDYYYSLFFYGKCYRESCYNCKFADKNRVADITMGDCWGVEELMPPNNTKNGVSVIIANSKAGEELLFSVVDVGAVTELDINWARQNNQNLIRPSARPAERNGFYDYFNETGFVDTAKKYAKIRHILPYLSRYIPRGFKKTLKKLLRRKV